MRITVAKQAYRTSRLPEYGLVLHWPCCNCRFVNVADQLCFLLVKTTMLCMLNFSCSFSSFQFLLVIHCQVNSARFWAACRTDLQFWYQYFVFRVLLRPHAPSRVYCPWILAVWRRAVNLNCENSRTNLRATGILTVPGYRACILRENCSVITKGAFKKMPRKIPLVS
jgi:hypothetical protein